MIKKGTFHSKQAQSHTNRLPLFLTAVLLVLSFPTNAKAQASCERTLHAEVVALDQVFFWNRLGVVQPQGMMFALKSDVVSDTSSDELSPGDVRLRSGKRPRPIVLRMNVGDCLEIEFTNLLAPDISDDEQVATRDASIHVIGMQLVDDISSDGSNVGANGSAGSGVVAPGASAIYKLYAEREGEHVLQSAGATTGGEGNGGQINAGLFGAVLVEPRGATWYRSQVMEEDLRIAAGDNLVTLGIDEAYRTAQGHPIVDYSAVYPDGHFRAGVPIFKMLDEYNNIVHTDLTAIIAGPFTRLYPENPVYPDRGQSFREFTIIYHDEIGAVQAFPAFFEDPVLSHTTASVRDNFAINYGTGAIGAEIIASRLGVGPMGDCLGCKYEEFFLTSWAVGDPAMVVDVPANNGLGLRATQAFYPDDPSNVYHSYLRDHVKFRILHGGSKEHHIHHQHAHQWLSSPDSDNSAYLDSQALGPGSSFTLEMVYNGSGNRNQTVGDSLFHCHFYPHFAQGMWALWRTHDVFEDGSRMLPDGEIAVGTPIPGIVPIAGLPMAPMPGSEVTIAVDPRYNQRGGQVQINGKFVRDMTEDDGEGLGNPGYPFWVPGVAGSRPPHPPMDTVDDGGLPRHVLLQGEALEVHTRLDFTKELTAANALALPEDGNAVELAAMDFHAQRFHDTFFPNGTDARDGFVTNGLPPVPGAPFADPCMLERENGEAFVPEYMKDRIYKAAVIQLDVIFNKAGWHFPQQRMITLWGDVQETFDGVRAPEPFFFRATTNDCISYYHTNLVPNVYELDDFQVRTPTDVLGQHIHLVKFDVMASDGSANGWNYEDGTFSPDEVRERINAINAWGGLGGVSLTPKPHPYFGAGPNDTFLGAQTTIQRWYADDVLNLAGEDRTLRTVFTHDHFGPSTHQQAGLYASLVVEPRDSIWRDPETGEEMGSNGMGREVTGPGGLTTHDGGPTSWRADILTGDNDDDSYREFMFQFADFGLAYEANTHEGLFMDNGMTLAEGRGPTYQLPYTAADFARGGRAPGEGFDSGFDRPEVVINPPVRDEIGLPDLAQVAELCPGGVYRPCPEAISADDVGTMLTNYRNEPIPLRIRDPNSNSQVVDSKHGLLAEAGDLSHVFRSDLDRADPLLNLEPEDWPYGRQTQTRGAYKGDPFTPILRAYSGDKVQVRVQVGSTEEGHNLSIHGVKWLFEPSWENSGFRNSQMMGISEHFEFVTPAVTAVDRTSTEPKQFADYLYMTGASVDDLWNGTWGFLRAYTNANVDGQAVDPPAPDLLPLPNNLDGQATAPANPGDFNGVCPVEAPIRQFNIIATRAKDVLPGETLVYNSRTSNGGPLHDPTAILFFRGSDVTTTESSKKRSASIQLKPGVPIEPLILRANAGDCITVQVENWMLGDPIDLDGFSTFPMIVDHFNANQVAPSSYVGLHPQLLAYNVLESDGADVGFNSDDGVYQTAPVVKTNGKNGGKRELVNYKWYAGDVTVCENDGPIDDCLEKPDGFRIATPIEFGATNLISSDRIKHSNKGAIGALIIEPLEATWVEDADSRASATVDPDGNPYTENSFREFVLLFQDDLNLRFGSNVTLPTARDEEGTELSMVSFSSGDAVPNLFEAEDPEDSGQKAFNYGTEPMWFRAGWAPDAPLGFTRNQVITDILTNHQVGGDPETPVFSAKVGMPVRFRVLEPGGKQRNHVFTVNGHIWQRLPYINGSTQIGDNPLSMWEGARAGHGPTNHFDAVLQNGAGGAFGVTGDYLFRDLSSFLFDGGLWGILRVVNELEQETTQGDEPKKPRGNGDKKPGGKGKK